MAWRKNRKFVFRLTINIFVAMVFLLLSNDKPLFAQENTLKKEQWEEVIKDYDYGDVKKKDKEDEEDKESKSNDYSGLDWKINPAVVKVVAISIIIILLTLLILQLMGIKLVNNKIERKALINYDHEGSPLLEDSKDAIYETEFERELRLALEAKNFRKAIRIYFVTIIDEMSLNHLIKKEKDKTNQRYISELRGKEEQAPFRKLARLFEIVWFGEVNLSEEEYHQLAPSFSDFLIKIISR